MPVPCILQTPPRCVRAARSTALACALLFSLLPQSAAACPFCPNLSPTLGEQYTSKTAAALARWSSGIRPAGDDTGSTTLELLQISRGSNRGLKPGAAVTVTPFRGGTPGDLFLLWGEGNGAVEWLPPIEFSETAWHYLTQAPAAQSPSETRLRYFTRFLEFPDDIIAEDAYREFAASRFEDIQNIAEHLPAEKLQHIIDDETVPEQRLGLYGMLLGLCGNTQSAEHLRRRILQNPADDAALGLDGMIGGYLLLTGTAGLQLLEQQLLDSTASTFARRHALLRAIEFMWTYGGDRISRPRLQMAVRRLLDNPETAERAVITLARWQDWTIRPQLMQLAFNQSFGTSRDRRILRKAVIGYLLAAQRAADEQDPVDSELRNAALQDLAEIRRRDPATWRAAGRFLRLPAELPVDSPATD